MRIQLLTTLLIAPFICITIIPEVFADHVWINEVHYDNAGADEGEFVEVVVRDIPGGQDLTAVQLDLYNGNNGSVYGTTTLDMTSETTGAGFAYYVWDFAGIQNGAPDGIALSVGGAVAQFLSYEGSFTATDGPADGLMSVDIGVAEDSTTEIGNSLGLTGAGIAAIDFVWSSPQTATPGASNTGQTLVPEPSSRMLLMVGLLLTLRRRKS